MQLLKNFVKKGKKYKIIFFFSSCERKSSCKTLKRGFFFVFQPVESPKGLRPALPRSITTATNTLAYYNTAVKRFIG